MKKTLFYAGAALAMVFSLNSCNKEIENPNENNDKKGIPFEIVANPVQTRTQMDGLDTKWVANDAINVFHSVSGATPKTYVSDGEFTIADVSTNRFQGTVSEALNAENSYDWYMVYPYNQYLVSVNNVGDNPARYYIGGRSDEAQTQNGNDNNEHIAGDNFPLYGVVTGLAANETPSISVNHVASYIEVSVTNNTEKPLTVESVSFTAPDGEKIMGYFNINFAADPISFTMYKTYASETASLTVNNGEEIATGEKGSFFLGIKPFTVSSGVLKVKVNGYEKVINITKSTSFAAGKIKKINFNYDKVEEEYVFKPENFELATSIAAGDKIIITDGTSGTVAVMKHYEGTNNNYKKVDALVSSGVITSTEDMAVLTVGGTTGNWTFLDESNSLYVDATGTTSANHLKANTTVTENGKWSVSFAAVGNAVITCTGKTSRNIIRYNNADGQNLFSCYSSGQQPVYIFKQLDPKVLQSITLSGNYQTEFYVNDSFNHDGLVVTATYDNETTKDVTSKAETSDPDMTTAGTKTVTVSYTEGGITKTATYDITVSAKPIIEMLHFNSENWDNAEKTVSNAQGSFSIGYHIANPVGTTTTAVVTVVTGSDWITVSNPNVTNNEVTQSFSISANSATGAARTATIKLSYTDAQDVVFEVTQAAGDDYVEPTEFNVWEDDFSKCKNGAALTSLSGAVSGFTGNYSNFGNTYPMNGAIRVGKASEPGRITTPALPKINKNSANLTISFKAAGWKGKTAKITLSASTGTVTEGQTTIASEESMTGSNPSMVGTLYTFHVTGANNTTKITFTTTNSIGIDDLVITQTN